MLINYDIVQELATVLINYHIGGNSSTQSQAAEDGILMSETC